MPPGSYTIRYARPNDIALLPAIEQAAAAQFRGTNYPDLADAPFASANIDLNHEHVWVAVDMQDQPVGFAIVRVLDRSVHLHEIDVHPSHARQGLGGRLITAVAMWARAQGATALTLTTFEDVPWNGPYYARLGFHRLDQAAITPALQAILQAEEAAGLPMACRRCMQLDLG
jgi:GNAT superfamily N-acetyltransferase